MDHEQRRRELADFLRTRRLRLTPSDVGLKVDTTRRRTSGLRREEVASLSGISLPWYTAMEQGKDIRVSEQVLLSLARTLQLNEDERNHLYVLANQFPSSHGAVADDESISPMLQRILDRFGTYPATVVNKRGNVIAWNGAARAVFGDFGHMEKFERNILWRAFMMEENKKYMVNEDNGAAMLLAQFRSQYALHVNDPWYQDLVRKLSEASPEFRELWGRHDVSGSAEGKKEILHPKAGLLTFLLKRFEISERSDFTMTVFAPDEGTGTEERLETLLAEDRTYF